MYSISYGVKFVQILIVLQFSQENHVVRKITGMRFVIETLVFRCVTRNRKWREISRFEIASISLRNIPNQIKVQRSSCYELREDNWRMQT